MAGNLESENEKQNKITVLSLMDNQLLVLNLWLSIKWNIIFLSVSSTVVYCLLDNYFF